MVNNTGKTLFSRSINTGLAQFIKVLPESGLRTLENDLLLIFFFSKIEISLVFFGGLPWWLRG